MANAMPNLFLKSAADFLDFESLPVVLLVSALLGNASFVGIFTTFNHGNFFSLF